mmetsp:Transcript_29615/g.55521  ORF Transcript_29615/g.55521 Transcript_29615/m.55521 type:complete len:97 (-) Transcript_29615:2304-2594(-)
MRRRGFISQEQPKRTGTVKKNQMILFLHPNVKPAKLLIHGLVLKISDFGHFGLSGVRPDPPRSQVARAEGELKTPRIHQLTVSAQNAPPQVCSEKK